VRIFEICIFFSAKINTFRVTNLAKKRLVKKNNLESRSRQKYLTILMRKIRKRRNLDLEQTITPPIPTTNISNGLPHAPRLTSSLRLTPMTSYFRVIHARIVILSEVRICALICANSNSITRRNEKNNRVFSGTQFVVWIHQGNQQNRHRHTFIYNANN
jgi:hypothetical protein